MTLRHSLAHASATLEGAGVASSRLAAETLLRRVLDRDRAYLYAHPEDALTPQQQARLDAWTARHAAGEPLQYITGVQEFYGREFRVTPAVLIPRPETELAVEAALERLPREGPSRVVDVGAGSGCIAITLALERPGAAVTAVDISEAALAVARANAARLGAAVSFVRGDLLAPLDGGWDLIISNPPYVAEAELAALAPGVRDHEPRAALVAGPLGTEIYARLIPQAARALRPGGWLVLELGYAAATAVRPMLGAGWDAAATRPDLQGWQRVLLARKPPLK